MSYISEWLTLSEAIKHIENAGEPEPPGTLRRACADGNIGARGLVDGSYRELGPEWWHPSAQVEFAAGRIVKGPTSKSLPIRTLRHKGDQLGPGDYQSIPVKGNLADAVEVSRRDVERIWPTFEPAEEGSRPTPAPAMPDPVAQLDPGLSSPTIKELQTELHSLTRGRVPRYEAWDHVDTLSVGDAACLWCDEEPEVSFPYQKMKNPTIRTYEALIIAGIRNGVVQVDHSGNVLQAMGDYAKSVVLREDLRRLAESKGLKPKFLFPELRSAATTSPTEPSEVASTAQHETQAANSTRSHHDDDRTGDLNSEELASARVKPTVDSANDRSSGTYSPVRLREWYVDWIAANENTGQHPSRDEDWKAAKAAVGDGVPRDAVWELRRELAPVSWTKKGRRKTVGDESVDE